MISTSATRAEVVDACKKAARQLDLVWKETSRGLLLRTRFPFFTWLRIEATILEKQQGSFLELSRVDETKLRAADSLREARYASLLISALRDHVEAALGSQQGNRRPAAEAENGVALRLCGAIRVMQSVTLAASIALVVSGAFTWRSPGVALFTAGVWLFALAPGALEIWRRRLVGVASRDEFRMLAINVGVAAILTSGAWTLW
jgi:hypothetical protein